ncbi:uncharacterized protein RJT21DRAFT_123922 [Scheffersomyces amazonensis]|uniref:uncharacterized protein n=1 Tax=Scheffersomyces amazonensis TaxID=1078765 RepID=UPI00315C8E09
MSQPTNTNQGTGSSWIPMWNSNPSSVASSTPDKEIESNSKVKTSGGKRRKVSGKGLSERPSTTSLNWLWSSKASSTNEADDKDHNDEYEDDVEDEDYTPDDNGDEIDDHVWQNRKKGTWNFWSSSSGAAEAGSNSSNNNNDNNDNNNNKGNDKDNDKEKEKEKEKAKESNVKEDEILEDFTNTIVNSTPSIPTKQELSKGLNNNASQEDDAVLYKPHDKTTQFNQINTHKNENLKENVIVPSWDSCLPNHSTLLSNSSTIASLLGSSSTANQGNSQNSKVDFKSWRHFLSHLSSRLGFSSETLTDVVNNNEEPVTESNNEDIVEKEFNLLYERTYKLYGRSLAKLPTHKRGCLPNYNKYYTKSNGHDNDVYRYDQQTQLEDDANDPNTISISNDPMGNLLINNTGNKNSQVVDNSEIITHKSGPLKKIQKVLIIGVHGFFPTKMIRPIIGAPKGTSLKFANEAEKAVIRYCVENNLITETESNISIQKIALEKEGKIFDRVNFFTEILEKWQNELNNADFIFIASHSQGCVVSIILLARLISLGILKDPIKKRISILGMAGINNGPFYGVDKSFFMKAYSAIEHDSLIELFELTKFTSEQSLAYKNSIQIIINCNVKLCFIGSINDQLVPLYSALASHIYHPNIYRACYIDHSAQTPLFIQKLVSLCCQLQNLGYFDNNVIKELSTVLAGTLTGGGHSKIYNDGKVYDLGIKFALDTDDIVIPPTNSIPLFSQETVATSIGSLPFGLTTTTNNNNNNNSNNNTTTTTTTLQVNYPVYNRIYIKEYNVGKIGHNPFILPWCLRGLLFNIEKNWPNNNHLISVESGKQLGKNGYDEINELYEYFEIWKPDSKPLKDLKFRLNGLRASKL